MPVEKRKSDIYFRDNKISSFSYEEIPLIVDKLVDSCKSDPFFKNCNASVLPSKDSVVDIVHKAREILFPGYFTQTRIDPNNLEYYLGQEVILLFENLVQQTSRSTGHECLNENLPCPECFEQGREASSRFIQSLPEIRLILSEDVRAACDGDPAVKRPDEVIFSYPGFFAVTVYRIAHVLYELETALIPRMMTEYAHSLTGIDIHPGARIGKRFFIDHGTGVVIGETTEIGDRVRIYQGVTLGALSLPRDSVDKYRHRKRHPTIGNDVIIYSNATILGENAVIGERSVIGGNVWITEPVPPDTKVLLKQQELIYRGNTTKNIRSESPRSRATRYQDGFLNSDAEQRGILSIKK